jgi:hypothetical protein
MEQFAPKHRYHGQQAEGLRRFRTTGVCRNYSEVSIRYHSSLAGNEKRFQWTGKLEKWGRINNRRLYDIPESLHGLGKVRHCEVFAGK